MNNENGRSRNKIITNFGNSNIFHLTIAAIFLVLALSIVIIPTASDSDESCAEVTNGECGDGLTWKCIDGTLTISKSSEGDGTMNAYASNAPWSGLEFTSVVIENGVKSIGVMAFTGCTGLNSIIIPDSVTTIGLGALKDCTGLTSVTIPNSVTSIDGYVFYGCTGLTSVTISNSVINIGMNAFGGCTGLTSIVIPDSVTTISVYAFYGCTGLTSITIPDKVTTINGNTFDGCTGLTSITIPDSVTSISNYVFRNCTNLTSITIPDSVTTIGEYAFNGCTNLTSITIPDSVTTIGEYAFNGCTGLTSITVPSSVTSIYADAFTDCTNFTDIVLTGTGSSPNEIMSNFVVWIDNKLPGMTNAFKNIIIDGDIDLDGLVPDTNLKLIFTENVTKDNVTDSSGSTATGNILSDVNLAGSVYTFDGSNWIKDTSATVYTVTLDANDGSRTSYMVASNGSSITLPTLTKQGHSFDGWYIAEDLSGSAVSSSYAVTEDITLYAKYTERSYTISYNANGGTGTITPDTVTYSDLCNGYVLKSPDTLTPPTGKGFLGWNIGSSVLYNANTTISDEDINGDVTIYAVWSFNVVTLDANGNGTNGNAVTTLGGVLSSIIDASREGYTLEGYYLETGCTTKVVNSDGTLESNILGYTDAAGKWIKTNATTLYAKWTGNTYSVTLDANGNGTNGSATATYDDVLSSIIDATREEYALEGYYLETDCTTKVVDSDGTLESNILGCTDAAGKWIKTDATTLYAKWTGNTYSVTLDANGNGTNGSATATYDDVLSSITNASRTGYTLEGYYLETDCTTKVIDSDGTLESNILGCTDAAGKWIKTDATTLYAKWTVNTYSVTLNANGGIVNTTSKAVTHGSTYGDLPTPTKNGFIFDGWYLNGVKITSSSTVSTSGNHTLVASWLSMPASFIEHSVKATFDANGGSVDLTDKTVTHGNIYGDLPTPTKDGYTFDGWYLDETKITSLSTVSASGDHTLTAKWLDQSHDTNIPVVGIVLVIILMALALVVIYVIRRKDEA